MSVQVDLSPRTMARKNLAARLASLYGPSGSTSQAFREVTDGAWMPGKGMRPKLTVCDNGQERAGYDDAETEKSMALKVQLVLDLQADWAADYDLWVAVVEDIILSTQNWLPVAGGLRMEYEDDDPLTVVLADDVTQELWVINFRATYMVSVGEIGKS